MVALKLRYSPQVMVAKQIVDEGTLGDIYYAECVADRRRGNPGGSFIRKATAGFGAGADIGVYALDTALYLMGHPKPVAVSAITSNYISLNAKPIIGQWGRNLTETEVEDFAAAWVRFENGARLVFKTCWSMHMDSLGGTIFLGTEAGLRIGVGEVRGPQEGVTVYRDQFGALTNTTIEGMRAVEGIELFRRENAAFAEAVREGKPSPIDPGRHAADQRHHPGGDRFAGRGRQRGRGQGAGRLVSRLESRLVAGASFVRGRRIPMRRWGASLAASGCRCHDIGWL